MFNVGFRPVNFRQQEKRQQPMAGDIKPQLPTKNPNPTPQPLAGSIVLPKPPMTYPPRIPNPQPLAGLITPPTVPTT